MSIELRPPEGFRTNNLGVFTLPDGYIMQPNTSGGYWVDDAHAHSIGSLLAQGWRRNDVIQAEARQREESDRLQNRREQEIAALSVAEIFKHLEEAGIELEARDSKLYMRGKPGPMLAQILRQRRTDILGELSQWREVL